MARTKQAGLRTKAAVLMAAGQSQAKIAEQLGVSRVTIGKIKREVASELQELEPELKEYRRQFLAAVPNELCARTTRQLIEQDEHLPTVLNAIVYRDKLLFGHLMQPEAAQQAIAPLFSLPAGSRVAIQIGPATRARVESSGDAVRCDDASDGQAGPGGTPSDGTPSNGE